MITNCIQVGGVIVSMLASSVVDNGFELGQVKQETMKLAFAASPIYMHHYGVKTKTDWLGSGQCVRVETCLPTDGWFSDLVQ